MHDFLPSFGTTGAFLAFIVGFGFLIFVHELGHFLVAKAVGIKVTQFAIGFGQSLVSYRKGIGFRLGTTEPEYQRLINEHLGVEEKRQLEFKEKTAADRKITPERERQIADGLGLGETEYRLNWMPLGGYVKMLGQEDLNPDAVSNDPRSFNAKAPWARACVISAGVTMNLIFAVIFFIVAFKMGVLMPPAVVGPVSPYSTAAIAYADGHQGEAAYRGLQPGDTVLSIDGEPATDFMQLAADSALSGPGEALKLTVQRAGVVEPLTFHLTPARDPDSGLPSVGIEDPRENLLELAPSEGPMFDAGLRPGMHLVAADGQKIDSFGEYSRAVVDAKGLPVKITFADNKGKEAVIPVSAVPARSPGIGDEPRNLIGLAPATRVEQVVPHSPAQRAGIKPNDYIAQFGTALWPAPEQFHEMVKNSNGQPMALAVFRDGKRIELDPIVTDRKHMIGITMSMGDDLVVGRPLSGSPSRALNLTAGSRILSVDGQPAQTWADLQRLLTIAADKLPATGGPITIGYQLNMAGDVKGQGAVQLSATDVARLNEAGWGAPMAELFGTLRTLQIARTPWGAVLLGFDKTHHYMLQTYVTLLRLFQGTVPVSQLHGPIVIAYVGTRAAMQGGAPFLFFFLGLLSVNLVVMNFLPIPIVDGGLMVFLIIEKLKGSPVNLRIQNAVNYVGLALIASIFLVTFFYDVTWLIH